jgi:pSer/pThr/pTyr-binding forkhead associated (FHA) protein
MASIIVMTGEQKGDYYPLGHRTNVIGRAENLPIQILDERVSRKHMKIFYDTDQNAYAVADMESKHGVLVNGIRISKTSNTPLKEEDVVTIGDTSLLFTLKDFENRESALTHFKKVGERNRPTIIQ